MLNRQGEITSDKINNRGCIKVAGVLAVVVVALCVSLVAVAEIAVDQSTVKLQIHSVMLTVATSRVVKEVALGKKTRVRAY